LTCFASEFGLDQIIFEITRKQQIETVKGTKHSEYCLDLVFTDDVSINWAEMCIHAPDLDDNYEALFSKLQEIYDKHRRKRKLL
jgi:hypothetical protein